MLKVALLLGIAGIASRGQAQVRVASPDRRNQVTIEVREGKLFYSVQRDGWAVFLPSGLGFEFRGAPPLRDGLRLADTTRTTDLPENYEHQPAFQFIRDVAVDWDTSRVLAGKIGDYVVVARRERNGPTWFIGAITDEEGRTFDIPLSFLPKGRPYVAEIYADGPGANWLTNPLPVAISQRPVDATTRLHLVLAPGGGQAIRIRPVR